LPTQKRRSRYRKVELPGYWVERYKGKWVTTVTWMGDCVFHFRVSMQYSSNCGHSCAYAERAQMKQVIRDIYSGQLGLLGLTKVSTRVWVFVPNWDIPLQWEASFRFIQMVCAGFRDASSRLRASSCVLHGNGEWRGIISISNWSCPPEKDSSTERIS
jgi:hypothetical protein